MNRDEQLTFLDLLNVLSFIIGIMNLNENLTQGDKQDLLSTLNKQTKDILSEIHAHLKGQDIKLDNIISRLEALESDS